MSQNELVALMSGLGAGALIAIILFCLAVVVVSVIASWKVFNKLGEPGWKCLIPIYNMYVLAKHTWKMPLFWVNLALYFVVSFINELTGGGMQALSTVLIIALLVLNAMWMYNISKSFGHGVGMAIVLFLFPTIASWILGYGSSQYIGNPNE